MKVLVEDKEGGVDVHLSRLPFYQFWYWGKDTGKRGRKSKEEVGVEFESSLVKEV